MALLKEKIKEGGNAEKAYNYLTGKGIKPVLASAIVGNLMQESYAHLDSTIENSIGAVGIAQWLGVRRKDLENFAKKQGKDFKDFGLQLDFLYKELTTTGNSWNKTSHKEAFFNSETPEEAAALFVTHFERSGEKAGEKGFENRIKNAQQVYNTFGTEEKKTPVVNTNREIKPEVKVDGTSVVTQTRVEEPIVSPIAPVKDFYDRELLEKSNRLLEEASVQKDEEKRKEEVTTKAAIAQQKLDEKVKQRDFLKEMIMQSGVKFVESPRSNSQMQPQPQHFEDGGKVDPKKKEDYDYFNDPEGLMKGKLEIPKVNYTTSEQERIAKLKAQVGDERDLRMNPERVLQGIEEVLKEKEVPVGDKIDANNYKTKEDIMNLQKMLVDSGYDLGKYGENKDGIDGDLGGKTIAALNKYNQENTPEKFISQVANEEGRRYDLEKRTREGRLSTQEQEELTRTQKPEEVGAIRDFLDFMEGNYSEHITQPIKNLANNILPDPLNSDPSLRTATKYDNTEGVRPLLIEDMSIEEIRKEKNISFGQISRNGRLANEVIPEKLKERVLNSIYPQGYGVDIAEDKKGLEKFEMLERFQSEDSKTKQVKRLPGVKGDNREDIFRMYAGLPQKHNTFTASSFKAGTESDTNITFSKPEDVADYALIAATTTDLFKKLANGEITPDTIKSENESGKKGGEKIHKASFRDPKNVMWNATFGVGYDGAGQPYLSFYDKWDLAGKDDNVVSGAIFGAPIEIYDRIPLTEEMIKRLSKVGYSQGNDGASDGISEDKIEAFLEETKKDKDFKGTYEEILEVIKNRY